MDTPPTKLAKLKGFMALGCYRDALRLANSFPQLGGHKERITRAYNAMLRQEFYREIGKDPAVLIADGIAAIRERYNLPADTQTANPTEWAEALRR